MLISSDVTTYAIYPHTHTRAQSEITELLKPVMMDKGGKHFPLSFIKGNTWRREGER